MNVVQRFGVVAAGLIALSAFSAVLPAPVAAGGTLFTVNRKGDAADLNVGNAICDASPTSGRQCTLRAAIQEANATVGTDSIQFNITSTPRIIAPTSPLPAITGGVAINGWSQAGTEANTLNFGNNAVFRIVLDGVNAGAGANGLELAGAQTNVFGLVIQRFSGSGILISGTENQVFGTFIGTAASGTVARGNGVGVTITGNDNTVGGGFASRRNLISGNQSHGVNVVGAAATGNDIQNGYIGTDRHGTARLANGGSGVRIEGGSENIVGIGSPSDHNLISGNAQSGITLTNAADNIIVGNFIGTDASGTQKLGNSFNGIHLTGASNTNRIGGSVAQLRNVVSANAGDGIVISASDDNEVLGNRIGTKSDGTGDLGNGETGVVVVGSDNTIGGSTSAESNIILGNDVGGVTIFGVNSAGNLVRGNTIAGNTGDGIDVSEGPNTVMRNTITGNTGHGVQVRLTTQARITQNAIFGNALLGIDLRKSGDPATGVTPNDANDSDSGANGLQNFPVLTAAVRSGSTGFTHVQGFIDSAPNTQYTIEIFIAAQDSSGHGEGQLFWGTHTMTTDSDGESGFNVQLAGLSVGNTITATATSTTAGNTSEFSSNLQVGAGP